MRLFALTPWRTLDDGDADPDDGVGPFASVSSLELGLWLVVVVAMLLDIVTTAYGLSNGLVERNPVVRRALDTFGLAVLPVLKLAAVALGLACRRAWPACAYVVPVGLAVPWSVAVGVNLALILSV